MQTLVAPFDTNHTELNPRSESVVFGEDYLDNRCTATWALQHVVQPFWITTD